MANDYIIYKWRLWFRGIDINRRGEISLDDVKDEEEIFADLGHLDAKQKKEMQENLERVWNNVVFRGKTGSITEEEFVELNKQHYTADKDKFFKELTETYTAFFTEVVDVNHEGWVNEEKFINMMRACRHENSGLNKKFFAMYNPVDGKVPLKALIDSWVQFTTCDDSSKRDVIKEAIESGV